MAFWNAPVDNPLHERDACRAALDMINAVNQLNMEREREAQESGIAFVPIRIGIGINTGQCVVGNMGSELRFQYTAMGDSVNLASRLEGQTATYKVPIIIGSATAEAVAADFALIEADVVRVKGKSRPEVVYALLGETEVAASPEFKQLKDQWSHLLLRYRKQDWAGVTELADRCRGLCTKFGLDGLVNLYRDRSRQFSSLPPPADWDGVYAAEFK
jgi:adenylate cyclase